MSIESRLTDVEESLRYLRDADRLQGRRMSAAAPSGGSLIVWNATTKKWEPKIDSIIEAVCTSNVTVTGATHVDVAGLTATFTPAIASVAIVWWVLDIGGSVTNDLGLGFLDVDGSDEEEIIVYEVSVGGKDRKTLGQVSLVSLTAASHTIKVTANRNSGSGTITVRSPFSRMVIYVVGDANATVI